MPQRHLLDMIRDTRPLILPPTATVKEACRHMREQRTGAVLVMDGAKRLLGIFTGRDAVCRVLAEGRGAAHTHLGDVMTPAPSCMPSGCTAIEALRLMQDGGFRHIPVVEKGRVVGVVTRSEFRGIERVRLDEETHIFERI
jgi:CBS domain-containing protein